MLNYVKKLVVITLLAVILMAFTASFASASGGNYHKVKYGETLYSIGRYYGVNPHYIAKANDLYNPDYIYAGQVLYIPSYGYDNDHNNRNYHTVRYGETLSSIGYHYGVSPYAIAKANHIYNLDYIYAGQKLYIPDRGYW